MRSITNAIAACAVALAAAFAAGAGADSPTLRFRVFADTGVRLTDILWTGKQFLYVENTTNRVFAAGPTGKPVQPFASMPEVVEETRCRLSPGSHGFAAGDIYCHSPDAKIYRLSSDGKSVIVFATLPDYRGSDGALTFDTAGGFGYELLAATGRSGSATSDGGSVYALDSSGRVRRVGDYDGPGGADEIVIAPRGFGTAAGKLLLTVDAGAQGTLEAMDAAGRTVRLVALDDGPNPIAVVPRAHPRRRAGAPPSGFYVTDTVSHKVYFVPGAQLARFRGHVIVGSEQKALFWVVRPSRGGFVALPLDTNLDGAYNLEGATYVR